MRGQANEEYDAQMVRLLVLWLEITIVVCLAPIDLMVREGFSAQLSDPQSGLPGNAAVEKHLLSWLAAQPLGLRLGEANGQPATVQGVQPGSAADRAGLQQGDVLVRVGDLEAPSPEQAAAHINNAWSAGKSAIELVVSRLGQDFYVVLRIHGG
jgi:S1-C subfamily serine protease